MAAPVWRGHRRKQRPAPRWVATTLRTCGIVGEARSSCALTCCSAAGERGSVHLRRAGRPSAAAKGWAAVEAAHYSHSTKMPSPAMTQRRATPTFLNRRAHARHVSCGIGKPSPSTNAPTYQCHDIVSASPCETTRPQVGHWKSGVTIPPPNKNSTAETPCIWSSCR